MTKPEDFPALQQLNEIRLGFSISQAKTNRRKLRLRRLHRAASIVFAFSAAIWLCHFFFGALL